MIDVDRLTKNYGSLRAVKGISFSVKPGEIFGLLGPNGAGKTTAINMISGILRPDEGSVTIDQFNLWESPKAAKRMLGLVPQDLALYEEFNARENLMFWGGLYGRPRAELKQNISDILERVGLSDRAREPIRKYSGGMKRRLNLAIGLVHKPTALLLDEPTVGIDPQARNTILEIIRDTARQGTTVIFTTHHLEEAEKLCDRIAIIDHGTILQTGSLAELAQEVGDRDIITLRGDFTKAQVQKALQAISVSYLTAADQCVSINVLQDDCGITDLVNQLSDAGIQLLDISIRKPTLEDVFLKLTGKELRD